MGFSVILDLLGSTIVGAILLLTLFRVNGNAVENAYTGTGELIAQEDLSTIVQILESDFRKIGYCAIWTKLPDPTKTILQVDTSSITYLTDVDNDGNVDTMHYYLGPTSELASTPNPRDRYLYRVINSETPVGVNLGVTKFKMHFYDDAGTELSIPIANPSAIHTMQIDLIVEDVSAYNEEYSSIFWRQIKLSAKNLRNR
jgi:hypothetical protein